MNTSQYIRDLNLLIEKMAHIQEEQSDRKTVHSKTTLLQLVKWDLTRIIYALLDMKTNQASLVLKDFFDDMPFVAAEVAATLNDDSIYHLGFRIYEPLDLVLYGFEHWTTKASQELGIKIQVSRHLRFPASQAFQLRVEGYTEILRIWVRIEEREFMLELFDIHSPEQVVHNDEWQPSYPLLSILPELARDVPPCLTRTRQLFNHDPIWHYALFVQSAEQVHQLHARFQQLVANCSAYRLPYQSPVENFGDRSLHTKLINRTRKLEVEFVTHLSQSVE